MAIFEIRQGALVPAQLGGVADESAHRQALDLVREQVAQVLRRPLFTVAWKQLDAGHSLVAIDGRPHRFPEGLGGFPRNHAGAY